MSTLTLRTAKGSPLTNAEVDANFTNLLVALGGANTSPYTVPTPTGTGSPVLSTSPSISAPTLTGHPTIEGVTSTGATGTGNLAFSASPTFSGTSNFENISISTNEFIGSQANLTRFPNSTVIVSNTAAGIQKNESHNIGLVAEGTANSSNVNVYGIGVYGVGYTASATRCGGVVGEGHVSASADTGSSIGVRGYANDVHAGGMNIGLYGDASNGLSNYALYLNGGSIYSVGAKIWSLSGNLTFSGSYSVIIPTLSLTNALTVGNGGTGATTLTGLVKGNGAAAMTAATAGTDYVSPTGSEVITNKTITTVSLKETKVAMAANDIDLATANYFSKTISGSTTLTVSNVPASGTAASFILDLTNGGSATITWWTGVKWASGAAPTLTSAGRDTLGFFTHDGGTTWTGLVLGKDIK